MRNRDEHPFDQVLNIVVLPFLFLGLMVPWALGLVYIASVSVHRSEYFLAWTAFSLGFFVFVCGTLFRTRIVRRISYCIMLLALAWSGTFLAWNWWTAGRFPVAKHDIDQYNLYQYKPFREDNKLVKAEVPAAYALDPGEEHPRLGGAYDFYPVYAATVQGMYPENGNWHQLVDASDPDAAYTELLKGEHDLIFAPEPSEKQLEEAEQAGMKYKLTPFCRDVLVFYVNATNPVDDLTTDQIRGIYSGRIADWKEVGAPSSAKIVPFQRNEGSGSQTAFRKLMDGTPVIPPLREARLFGAGDLINDTACYRNYKAALGFSFRCYTTELLRNNRIKLLSVDGVAPTVENIRNGSYPLVATAYMVTVRPRSENVQKIMDYMLSPAGQKLVEETGHIPLGTPAAP